MARSILYAVLLLLGATVQVSQALHFTNTIWNITMNQDFLIQWAYDEGDVNNSTWNVVLWLTSSQEYVDDGVVLLNRSYSPDITSYKWNTSCDLINRVISNTTFISEGDSFGIGFKKYEYPMTDLTYSKEWIPKEVNGVCGYIVDPAVSSGDKILMGVTIPVIFIAATTAVFVFFRQRRRARQRGDVALKNITPRAADSAYNTGSNPEGTAATTEPPPYSPRM